MRESATEPRYVHAPEHLSELLDVLRRSDAVALDTEFIPEGSYEPRLCLIQLATTEGVWLVDPLATGALDGLWGLLTDPARELVAMSAAAEVRFCLRGAGRPPARLLDLQIAAGLLGYGYPLSHTRLLERVLGVHVKGGETYTDWSRRPLTAKQLRYASDDVRYLLAAREKLLADARAMNRMHWVESECRQLIGRILRESQDEGWRRIAGTSGFDRRELGVLREAWAWRDETARRTDRPARTVLPDHLLIGIARRRPTKMEDLQALRGMARVSLRRVGDEILAAVRRGLDAPESDLPAERRREDPPQVGVLAQLLAVATNALARQHRLDPVFLATAADLQELVRWRLGLSEPEPKPGLLQGWRGEIAGERLMEILAGQYCLRVTDLKARNPVAFERPAATPSRAEPGSA